MSPQTRSNQSRTSTTKQTRRTGGQSSARASMWTPARIGMAVLTVLLLIFIFENTRNTKIRLIIPEVTMPLWLALLITGVIGAVLGAYAMSRRRR
ncbi:DUF1049 domain-containing protein [Streptomyces cavernae]|uniref:DUF1049 domain-containing protein n=1 Tax=Streptomyces cavernae TaxID=2259034 RepID=UPI001EE3E08E|nr:DUF1049 domain-containing protein [Streptomyces cavernae]